MIHKNIGLLAGVAALAVGLAACGSSSKSSTSSTSSGGAGTISGAGSTFAAPVYQQWASQQSGLTVNYQAVGSGAGITALAGKTVDFGASDPPLKPADESAIAKNGSPAVQIPMFLGAITVIHRSDSSGTTAGFTAFLAATDPEFKSKVGEGKDVQWPVGTGAKGNAGVAGAIEQTTGSVGYVEQAYALQHNFTVASVKNKAGNYVAPSLASTTAAAQGIAVPANLGIKTVNASGVGAYPIASQTFIVVNKDMCKAGIPGGESAAKGVSKFITYGLGEGQAVLSQADYAPLPAAVLEKSKAAVAGLQCNGSALKP